jgi:hypothetical protein
MFRTLLSIAIFCFIVTPSLSWAQQSGSDADSNQRDSQNVDSQSQAQRNALPSNTQRNRNQTNQTNGDAQAQTSVQGDDSTRQSNNRSNAWRYRWHNGEWWYWHPEQYWLIRRNGQWSRYDRNTYQSPTRSYVDTDRRRETNQANDNAYRNGRYNTGQGLTTGYRGEAGYRGEVADRYDAYGRPYFTPNDGNYDGRYRYSDGYYGRPYNNGLDYSGNQPYWNSTPSGRAGAGIGGAIGRAIGGDRGADVGANIGGAIGSDF